MIMRASIILGLSTVALMSAIAPAQGETGSIRLEAAIGSMKMIDGNGKVTMSFNGTVVLINLQGTATPAGGLKLEYDANGRKAYFGKGTLTIQGKWRGIQWFGRDLACDWNGAGMVRLYGEYDKDLKLGWFQYSNSMERESWQNGGRTIFLPDQRQRTTAPVPRPRSGGG